PVQGAEVEVSAQSALVMTADAGSVLFQKDANTQRPMASTTKIMTALLTLEAAECMGDPTVEITQEMVAVEGSAMGLREGDRITLTNLAAGMLLASGNDAANAAALYLDGSLEKFAQRMNSRAAELGMENTHFVTPSGLEGEDAQGLGHYSTAFDMALLAREALKNEKFRQLCGSASAQVEFEYPVKRVTFTNHNKLLTLYPGCIGVKTGFTKAAGRCLVSAAERDGVTLIAVTLNAPNDWDDHAALLDYGFTQTEPYDLQAGDVKLTVPVVGSDVQGVLVRGGSGATVTLAKGDAQRVTREISVPAFLYAPVSVGDPVGEVRWYLDGTLLGRAPITAGQPAGVLEKKPGFWARLIGME
ncbi:MAG: D-alanyl-D-alanine carboxypeptidase family protein, partial [Acutalibacter sp.]